MVNNYRNGLSIQESLTTHINFGQITGSIVSGAIIGGTLGAAGGVVSLGFGGNILLGAGANVASTQVEAIYNATFDEVINHFRDHGDFDAVRIWEKAVDNGFLDPNSIMIDSISGAIGGMVAYGVGAGLTNVAKEMRILPLSIQDPVVMLQFTKIGPDQVYQLIGVTRRPIYLSKHLYNSYLEILTLQGIDKAARWLFNNVTEQIEGQLDDT